MQPWYLNIKLLEYFSFFLEFYNYAYDIPWEAQSYKGSFFGFFVFLQLFSLLNDTFSVPFSFFSLGSVQASSFQLWFTLLIFSSRGERDSWEAPKRFSKVVFFVPSYLEGDSPPSASTVLPPNVSDAHSAEAASYFLYLPYSRRRVIMRYAV